MYSLFQHKFSSEVVLHASTLTQFRGEKHIMEVNCWDKRKEGKNGKDYNLSPAANQFRKEKQIRKN